MARSDLWNRWSWYSSFNNANTLLAAAESWASRLTRWNHTQASPRKYSPIQHKLNLYSLICLSTNQEHLCLIGVKFQFIHLYLAHYWHQTLIYNCNSFLRFRGKGKIELGIIHIMVTLNHPNSEISPRSFMWVLNSTRDKTAWGTPQAKGRGISHPLNSPIWEELEPLKQCLQIPSQRNGLEGYPGQ